jgi:hypothetical protein
MNSLDAARQLVTSPLISSLLFTHPNDLSATFSRPTLPFREPWWAWASDTTPCRWMQLLEYYTDPAQRTVCSFRIVLGLTQLCEGVGHTSRISAINRPSICPGASQKPHQHYHRYRIFRARMFTASDIPKEVPLEISSRGMSPKKAHEVLPFHTVKLSITILAN